jgi:hypothetical protein
MSRTPVLHRLALALALVIPATSLVAIAGEATETTEIEVVANGVSEKLSIDDLKVGETRQLYSEAGTLVTATRTAESLELDIAGDKTSIRMLDPHAIDDPEIAALLEAHGAPADGHKRVVRIHRDGKAGEGAHAAHVEGHRKVIVVKADGEFDALDGADVDVIVKGLAEGDADGKKVIVKRRLSTSVETDSK